MREDREWSELSFCVQFVELEHKLGVAAFKRKDGFEQDQGSCRYETMAETICTL